MEETASHSNLSAPAWQVLERLDPTSGDEANLSLAAHLALTEQRFMVLYQQVLVRLGEPASQELVAEADILADAHHTLSMLEDSLHATSRRMLDVLDRMSRELGE
jgi:hypothetical protein